MLKLSERLFWIVLVGLLLGCLTLPYAFRYVSQKQPSFIHKILSPSKEDKYQQFFKTNLEYLQKYYIKSDSLSKDKLFFSALNGFYQGTGDSYTNFLDETFFKEVSQDIEGSTGGIGVYLSKENNITSIIHVVPHSPAFKAGIKAGDIITQINHKNIFHLSLDTISKTIQGAPLSRVTIKTFRQQTNKHFQLTLVRKNIMITSTFQKMLSPNIGYLKINEFTENTSQEVETILRKMNQKTFRALVLDLRDNTGGLLTSSIKIADMFIQKGLIVSTQEKDSKNNKFFKASALATIVPKSVRIIVLINENTASAAEVLASSLQDSHRGTLVGQKSFGKGSIQSIFPLSFEGKNIGIKITTAYYRTSRGKIINHIGITPDIFVKNSVISPLQQEKINVIIQKHILLPFIKRDHKKTISPILFKKIKETLKKRELSLPNRLLLHIIKGEKNLLQGNLDFVDILFDKQLKKAFLLLSK